MNTYTPFDGRILVPMQIIQLKFAEKEDISLNPFQNLILEAIEEGCGVEEIVQATLLEKQVIEAEIVQLITQKLLERQGEVIQLSRLSERLLLVSRCVQHLNEEKRPVCMNLITGAVEEYNLEHLVETADTGELEFRSRIQRPEIEGISIGENIEFFQTYLDSFGGLKPEQIEMILSSVYIEHINIGERGFRVQPISRIPCLIGNEEDDGSSGDAALFWAEGHMCRVEFSLKSALNGVDDKVLPNLPALADAGLLLKKGKTIAEAVERFQRSEPVTAWYDYVSGELRFDEPEHGANQNRIDLELPSPRELTRDDLDWIVETAHSHLKLPRELTLGVKYTNSSYVVCGALDQLWEADDG